MRTKQQFGDELRVCRWQLSFALVGVTVLWMLVLPVICDLPWFHSHTALQGAFIVLALVLLAVSYAVVAKILYSRRGLVCPSCGDWMGSQSRMLSTGRCPRCKAEVFHES
jgi:hypothetical protein